MDPAAVRTAVSAGVLSRGEDVRKMPPAESPVARVGAATGGTEQPCVILKAGVNPTFLLHFPLIPTSRHLT